MNILDYITFYEDKYTGAILCSYNNKREHPKSRNTWWEVSIDCKSLKNAYMEDFYNADIKHVYPVIIKSILSSNEDGGKLVFSEQANYYKFNYEDLNWFSNYLNTEDFSYIPKFQERCNNYKLKDTAFLSNLDDGECIGLANNGCTLLHIDKIDSIKTRYIVNIPDAEIVMRGYYERYFGGLPEKTCELLWDFNSMLNTYLHYNPKIFISKYSEYFNKEELKLIKERIEHCSKTEFVL